MSRCDLCPGIHNCVEPSGPENSEQYGLGEAPGSVEDKKKEPFCGKTGDEVNRHYLPVSGLSRPKFRMNNAIRCLPPGPKGKLDPKKQRDLDLLQSCAEHHLYPELERLRPKLIIPMGAFACRAIDPSINLELQHGFPVDTPYGQAFPMYHPAGGIHEPKKMLIIRTDWTRLRKYLAGKLRIPVDHYAGGEDYRWLQTEDHVDEMLWGQWENDLAADTEVMRGGTPFCITGSTEPGTGWLIRAEDTHILKRLQWHLDRWKGKYLFHNWLFDEDVTLNMGLRFRTKNVIDTMRRVFHLGNLPQGLKPLATRELGMRMQDFDDVVTPYSRELVLNYYRNIYAEDWPKPEAFMERESDGSWKVKKPHGMNQKIKTFFTYYAKDEEGKEVFDTWKKNWTMHHDMVEEVLGPWPGKCVSHAPFDEVLYYAVRDADATLRLWRHIKQLYPQVRRKPQEHWGDKVA